MKNKIIFKILTVTVMLSLVLSLSCISASAFDKSYDGLQRIPGYYDPDCPGYIYHEEYVVIDLGLVSDLPLYGFADGPCQEITTFLMDLHYGNEPSPIPDIHYLDRSVNFMEFLFYDPHYDVFVDEGYIIPYASGSYYKFEIEFENELFVSSYGGDICLEASEGLKNEYSDPVYPGRIFVVLYMSSDYSPWSNFNDWKRDLEEMENSYYDLEESYENALDYIEQQEASIDAWIGELQSLRAEHSSCEFLIDDYENYINSLEYANASLSLREKELRDDILDLEADLRTAQDLYDSECKLSEQRLLEIKKLNNRILDYENNADVGNLFIGISEGLLIFIRGVGSLGYTTPGGISITIGGLLTVAVLGAFLTFALKKIFGRD